jgi:radical SAM superfamily enzyme YgiQ (UPF0313 family)
MRIAFVNPNLRGEFRVNIGLAYLLSYIKHRTSHEVCLIDVTFYRRDWKSYVSKIITKYQPDVVGCSVLTYNFFDALQITNYMKTICPQSFVIFGGIHPSTCPQQTLQYRIVDAVCIGEGEYTLAALLDRLEEKRSLKGLPGIWYKENRLLIKNPPSQFIQDLDSLPFVDWSFFELEKYAIVNPYEIAILGTRGCPFNCSYCINPVLRTLQEGKYYRHRSVPKIIAEMKYQYKNLKHLGLKYFYFWDDMFNLDNNFVQDFCNSLIKSGLLKHISWSCSSRIDTINAEILDWLSHANLNFTRIGIESGNYLIRKKIYFKDIKSNDIIQYMDLIHRYGIKTQCDFILGGPTETEENIWQSYSLMKIINPTQVSINIYQPYPCIKSNELFLEDGGTIIETEWTKIKNFFDNSPIRHKHIKKKRLLKIAFKIRLAFLIPTILKYFKQQKIRFVKDIILFLIFFKMKYNLLWHDLFKITIRKYIYEENIPSILF